MVHQAIGKCVYCTYLNAFGEIKNIYNMQYTVDQSVQTNIYIYIYMYIYIYICIKCKDICINKNYMYICMYI